MQITDHEIAIQEVLAQMRSMAVSARAGVEPSQRTTFQMRALAKCSSNPFLT